MTTKSNDLSRLALGTVQFGLDYGISNKNGKTDFEEVKKILNAVKEAGIDTIDTASAYGNSEEVIGNAGLQGFNIVSKFPASVCTGEDLKNFVEKSLKNLKINSLYGYLAHDADSLLMYPGLWKSLQELKEKGIVKKIGYSLYLPVQLEKLLSVDYIPDIVQVPYNFIDRRFEKYFDKLKSLGCEIHVRSAFLQGLFFMDPLKLPEFFNPVKQLLGELKHHFKNNDSLAGFLMSFVLNRSEIDKLVFGINTVNQFHQNISNIKMQKLSKEISLTDNIPVDILTPNKWPR